MYKKYGLLGHPLGHSFSRKFHNERFSRLGIDAEYVNFDLENISLFPTVLANEPLLCGLNVTIPYKQQVMQLTMGRTQGWLRLTTRSSILLLPESER